MTDMKEYLWLIKTSKGDFFITVLGDWTLEEAAKKVREVFTRIELEIIAMIPRKRATGPQDSTCTIFQREEPSSGVVSLYVDEVDYSFYAGKTLWEVCGRGAEYEAENILQKKEVEAESK